MKYKINLGLAISAMLIAMAITFSVTMILSMNMFNNTVSRVKNKERMYNKLSEIDKFASENEYFDINDDTLNDTIASGYVLGISDRYAQYYSSKAFTERQGLLSGKLMGIGVAVVKDASSGYGRIIKVYENTPATEMGMESGGYITMVGNVSVKSMTTTAAITSAMLGEEGTTVSITYMGLNKQEYQYDITHTSYVVSTVSSQMLNESVGYIKVDAFSSNTATEFRSAVDNLRGQGASRFVLDVRDNTGESLSAALTAADYCVPSGLMGSSINKSGDVTDLRISDENMMTEQVVVLVNSGTAEGAELFASCLKQMGGATLVGGTTAGKGALLSDPQSLSDGSAVVITVGLLQDCNGQSWNGTGLTPDVDASLSADEQANYYDFTVETDPQINRALSALTTG